MNRLTPLAIALLLFVPAFAADHKRSFPKADPAFSIHFAESWRFIPDGEATLFAQSIAPQDEAVTVELRALQADQPDQAAAEADKHLRGEFGGFKTGASRTDVINALKVVVFKAVGENSDGGRMVIQYALFRPAKSGRFFMLTLTCTPGEESRHAGDLAAILGSVKPLAR